EWRGPGSAAGLTRRPAARAGTGSAGVVLMACFSSIEICSRTVATNFEEMTMGNARVTGLRSVELGVRDLEKSADFYRKVWGLEDVVSEGDTIHLRATGTEHHVVTLRQRPTAALLNVHFAASSPDTVKKLHAQAIAYGASVDGVPAALARSAGS